MNHNCSMCSHYTNWLLTPSASSWSSSVPSCVCGEAYSRQSQPSGCDGQSAHRTSDWGLEKWPNWSCYILQRFCWSSDWQWSKLPTCLDQPLSSTPWLLHPVKEKYLHWLRLILLWGNDGYSIVWPNIRRLVYCAYLLSRIQMLPL